MPRPNVQRSSVIVVKVMEKSHSVVSAAPAQPVSAVRYAGIR